MNFKRLIGGLLLGAFSLLIAYSTFFPLRRAIEQQWWEKLECTIERAELDGRDSHGLSVSYWYEVGGTRHKGSIWALPSPVQPSLQQLQARINRFQTGVTVPCWLSPERVDLVVLERESLWVGAMQLIPLFGLTGAYFLLRTSRPQRRRDTKYTSKLSTSNTGLGSGTFALYGFFSIFVVVGLALSYLFFFRHLIAVWQAQGWNESTCTITSSEVQSHTSRDSDTGKTSTTYSVNTSYTFEYNGKRYSGDTYSLGSPDNTNSKSAHAAIEKIPLGSVTTCYFNPLDPTQSALHRDLESVTWAGLIPLIFTAAGLMGMVFVFQQERSTPKKSNSGKNFKKAQNRFLGLLGLLFATIVWNGIVGAGVYAFFSAGTSGWFFGIIIIPFALIGILLIAAIPLSILQLCNPSVDFEIPHETLHYGENYSFAWKLNGSPRRIRRFSLHMALVEEHNHASAGMSSSSAQRSVGTAQSPRPTAKAKHLTPGALYEKEIFHTASPEKMTKGAVSCRLPDINEIEGRPDGVQRKWKLTALMEISWFPDSQEVVEFGVAGSNFRSSEDEE